MFNFGYCQAWPDELKELSRVHYRAQQRARNLEAYIERVDPDDFYAVMAELEKAKAELLNATFVFEKAQRAWDADHVKSEAGKATQA